MAKVFTITEGLENLGALKSGGQGSVYKARRRGDIITAIKILPTPIASESEDDKNFISFQNEVQKLKKVNETPNPNVVSIVESGITTTGNLPFIEMEYIEGPDLGELLTPPYDPVFMIKEIIKVADHLSNALAHCHRAAVKHGDIKSNNIKFNQRTGNYILLDFGLSIMSDEQRRTSIRHAGAIEFMAPEQNAGTMLFETDIYSLGIILFELLAGTVPFPLKDKGEMARNSVMIAHMESAPPDVISLRRQTLPTHWSQEKREREMQVPVWMTRMLAKCLEKDPSLRFRNGMELQEYIHSGIVAEENKKEHSVPNVVVQSPGESQLMQQIQRLELRSAEKDRLIDELQTQVDAKDKELYQLRYMDEYNQARPHRSSKSLVITVFLIIFGFGGYAAYHFIIEPMKKLPDQAVTTETKKAVKPDSIAVPVKNPVKKSKAKPKKVVKPVAGHVTDELYEGENTHEEEFAEARRYRVLNTAFFYSRPDEQARRNAYLTSGDKTITAMNEEGDFVFVVYTNVNGETTKGWLKKDNLIPIKAF